MITAVTANIPSIPLPMIGRELMRFSILKLRFIFVSFYPTIASMSPPAITDAICPDTFTPTACIRRKF